MDIPRIQQELSQFEYEIGWLCVLKVEYYAARKILDEEYPQSELVHGHGDNNRYTLGRIGDHRVVINRPAAATTGIRAASQYATNMKSTFPAIRFMLVVGIGGGAPTLKNDIRLGDVVMGTKVVPYKVGKETGERFQITGNSFQPPKLLLEAITDLEFEIDDGLDLEQQVDSAAAVIQQDRFKRPDHDHLFDASSIHNNERCSCVQSQSFPKSQSQDQRKPRGYTKRLRLHQGTIGSADQVMKNAAARDRLAAELDIICFEMEGAGVERSISIRGIADYSDSHKNDEWHDYAALAAVVSAKLLLKTIRARDISNCSPQLSNTELVSLMKGIKDAVEAITHKGPHNSQSHVKQIRRLLDILMERHTYLEMFIGAELGKLNESSGTDITEARNQVVQLQGHEHEIKDALIGLEAQTQKWSAQPLDQGTQAELKALKKTLRRSKSHVEAQLKVTHHTLNLAASAIQAFPGDSLKATAALARAYSTLALRLHRLVIKTKGALRGKDKNNQRPPSIAVDEGKAHDPLILPPPPPLRGPHGPRSSFESEATSTGSFQGPSLARPSTAQPDRHSLSEMAQSSSRKNCSVVVRPAPGAPISPQTPSLIPYGSAGDGRQHTPDALMGPSAIPYVEHRSSSNDLNGFAQAANGGPSVPRATNSPRPEAPQQKAPRPPPPRKSSRDVLMKRPGANPVSVPSQKVQYSTTSLPAPDSQTRLWPNHSHKSPMSAPHIPTDKPLSCQTAANGSDFGTSSNYPSNIAQSPAFKMELSEAWMKHLVPRQYQDQN